MFGNDFNDLLILEIVILLGFIWAIYYDLFCRGKDGSIQEKS
jgi:hypothetical protein